jgi:hypothetical protein
VANFSSWFLRLAGIPFVGPGTALKKQDRIALFLSSYHAVLTDKVPRKPRRRTCAPQVLLRCPLQSQRGKRIHQPAARCSELGHVDREKDAMDSELQLLTRYGHNDCVMALGRRDWLFADAVKGAKASAALYCIVSTARANGLEPYAYLRRLFAELPKAKTLEDFEALLPFSRLSGKANL